MSGGTHMPGAPDIPFHPLANLFPMLSDKELDELGLDIEKNQQAETIKLHKGMLLDGRSRYTACVRKGIPCRYEHFTGSDHDALNWVISKNLRRRHLTESQRAMVAAKLATLKLGDNQHSAKPAPIGAPSLPGMPAPVPTAMVSQTEAADMLNVGRRSLQRATVVEEKGSDELQKAVESGDIAVSTAAEIAERPVEEQKTILDALPRDEAGMLTPEAKAEVRKVAKEVRAEDQIAKKKKRDDKEAKLGAKIRALPDVKAGLILSDFEWHFKVHSEETGMDRHAANHYVTAKEASTPEQIVERQRERMSIAADDSIHLMWTTSPFLAVALKVMELQGFKYVSHFIWIKPGIGTGFWVRECHELLLIGVRGAIPCPAMGDQFNSKIEAPRGEHSEKPDFQYEIAERYFPTLPKIELNARRFRPGWIAWGNQAPEPPQQQSLLDPKEEAA